MGISYNEQWNVENQQLVSATYVEAGRTLDLQNTVWSNRMQFDAASGRLAPDLARWRHLNELRAELTLAPIPFPRARQSLVQVFPWRGFSDFLLYQRFLAGENLDALCQERVLLGAGLVRVLGMVNSFSHFWPQEHADYVGKLPAFVAYLASFGLAVEFVVFADAQVIRPALVDQRAWFLTVANALRGLPGVALELVNEYQQNGVDPLQFSHPGAGLLCSRGSAVGDVPCLLPGWDYHTFHETRNFPNWIKDANLIELINGYLGYPGTQTRRSIHDEPMGYDEVAQPGRRVNDPVLAFQFATIASTSCEGATFHSTDGINSLPLRPVQTACAREFFRGLSVGSL